MLVSQGTKLVAVGLMRASRRVDITAYNLRLYKAVVMLSEVHMLDPDIEGRMQSLQREHLAAVFAYMLGEGKIAEQWAQTSQPRFAEVTRKKSKGAASDTPRSSLSGS
jgi:hypothetical protein